MKSKLSAQVIAKEKRFQKFADKYINMQIIRELMDAKRLHNKDVPIGNQIYQLEKKFFDETFSDVENVIDSINQSAYSRKVKLNRHKDDSFVTKCKIRNNKKSVTVNIEIDQERMKRTLAYSFTIEKDVTDN